MNHLMNSYFKVNRASPVYFLVVLLALTACIKDKISNECKDLNTSELVISGPNGPYYKFIGEQLKTPSFNPNNDNEIMFVRENTGTSDKQIWLYNLIDKSKDLIFEGEVLGRPRWGKNDYIIFYRMGGHIWKIRSDGQNLTYLNNPMPVYDPQWNSEGTKFATNAPPSSIYQGKSALVIFNETGSVLDTIPLPIAENYVGNFNAPSSFKREEILVLRRPTEITFFDTKNEVMLATYHTQLGFDNQTSAGGNIFWLDSTNLIYGNRDGIHQITYPSLQNTHLIKSCTNKVYFFGDINMSKTKMVWAVRQQEINSEKTHVLVQWYLVIMDLDGSNEQRLEISF